VLCTFSAADLAVGWWYRAASSLARQDIEAAATSPTSGEAWATTATSSRHRAGSRSRSRRKELSTASSGQFYLLASNAVIKTDQSQFSRAHSDIRHPEVVRPVVDASR
jgi:hypothetical protein